VNKVNKLYYVIPKKKNMYIFLTRRGLRGRNILSVAAAPFVVEKDIKINGFDVVSVPLFFPKLFNINLIKLKSVLKDLFGLILLKDIDFLFRNELKSGVFLKENKEEIPASCQAICLFSGGVDSYCGILQARERDPEVVGLFCAHSDQSKIISTVEQFSDGILTKRRIRLVKLSVPEIKAIGYSQMRGFLYFVSAAAWMDLLNAKKLIITEVGPTMYQPRFAYFDSVTLTAHPYVLRCAQKAIELLLGRKIELILPYENMTKAEIISICPDKHWLKKTLSCISQRFGKHDGTCYACVMRRLAFTAAGIEDVEYIRDPIVDPKANNANLIALLRYNQSYLMNYKEMRFFQIENIEMFKKYDLFRRFALDNITAIYKLIMSNQRVIKPVANIYKEVSKKLGTDIFEHRLEELQKGHIAPNFDLPFSF
jgi:7-cyano-7-deazaguanine synthase in queuosine biosynthesis